MTIIVEDSKKEETPTTTFQEEVISKDTLKLEEDAGAANAAATESTQVKTMKEAKVGDRIAKSFMFYGTIKEVWKDSKSGKKLFHVEYDDSDTEDFDRDQAVAALALYEENKDKDRKKGKAANKRRANPAPYRRVSPYPKRR